MRKSYIGIFDRSGLSVLLPEAEHVDRFLLRRALRKNAVCFWAVMDDAVAQSIRMELNFGQHQNAGRLLQLLATDYGSILPPHTIEVVRSV